MTFGKSNAKVYVPSTQGIRFSDVAGEDEAKESLAEIVDYLHNSKKYTEAGASMPKAGSFSITFVDTSFISIVAFQDGGFRISRFGFGTVISRGALSTNIINRQVPTRTPTITLRK